MQKEVRKTKRSKGKPRRQGWKLRGSVYHNRKAYLEALTGVRHG